MAARRGNVRVTITGDASHLDRETRRAEGRMSKFGAVAKRAAFAGAAGIAAGTVASIKSFADFDSAMTASLAIMGDVTKTQRQDMVAAAREVGRTSKFSAREAAEGYFFLASAGLDAAQSVKAMPAVAKFAQAGNFDLALATDLVTDAQSALGLSSKRAGQNLRNMTRVSDVLVKANTLANASVEQFSESLTNKVGAAAKVLGKDVEETTSVLAAFADQGVKGREAGTGLSIVWRDLQTAALRNKQAFRDNRVAVFDANGEMRHTSRIVGDLEQALAGMSDREKKVTLARMGFTDRSQAFLLTLLGSSRAIATYDRELRRAGGTSETVARKQMRGLTGAVTLLKSQVSDAALEFGGKLAPHVEKGVRAVTGFIDGVRRGRGAGGSFVETLKEIGARALPVALSVGNVALAIARVGYAFGSALAPAAIALAQFGLSVGQAMGPVALTIGNVSLALGRLGMEVLQSKAGLVALTAIAGALVGRLAALGVAWGVSRIMAFVGAIRSAVATMAVLRTVYVAQTGVTNASTVAILRHAVASRVAAAASRGLAAAMASTGFGAVLVAVGLVAGALLGMKHNTDEAKYSADNLNDSLRRQIDAMRAIRDIDIDVANRRTAVRRATIAVQQAQQRLQQLQAQGKQGTLEYRDAEVALEEAQNQRRRAVRDLNRADEDAAATRQRSAADIRGAQRDARTEVRRLSGEIRDLEGQVEKSADKMKRLRDVASDSGRRASTRRLAREELAGLEPEHAALVARLTARRLALARANERVSDTQRKLGEIQLQTAKATDASRQRIERLSTSLRGLRQQSRQSSDKVRGLRREIAELRGKTVNVRVNLDLLAPDVFPGGGPSGDGWGLARAVRRGAQRMADRNPLAFMGGMGGLGGGRAGAVDAFTPLARRMGLPMSSGYRPGSITSSGNQSYHALNRARDYAGSAGAMLAFARLMASRFGARLKELIYSPLGWSIKNGQRVAPYAVKDHYDHVHVAMRRGGLVPSMLSPGEVGVTPGGHVFRVPGRPTAADTVPMSLPVGTAVLTGHGQQLMAGGATLGDAVRRQRPHFRRGGVVTTGYTTYSDPPPGAYGGSLAGGYAELGTAVGNRATGVGNLAMLLGRKGELPENFPLTVTINGRTRTLRKRDRGFGQGGGDGKGGGGSNSRFTFDIWRDSWSHFGIGAQSSGTARIAAGGSRGKDSSFTRLVAPKVTYPLLGNMLAPLVDDALLGGIDAGANRTGRAGRRELLTQILEGIVPEAEDRAGRERVTVKGGRVGKRVERMVRAGDAIASKKLPYQYGGYGNPSYDCSGYASKILNAGGLLKGRLDTVAFKGWGKAGRGDLVTLGIRGGAGRSGHMMMRVGGRYYEASGKGVGRRSGWSGDFDTWRRPAWRRGGIVGPGGRRMLPPSPEGMAHLTKVAARAGVPISTLLDPRSRMFVGWGLRDGSGDVGSVVGRTRVVRGPRRKMMIADLLRLLSGSPGTEGADRLTRRLAGAVQGAGFGVLLRRQRQARRQIRGMARDGFTGTERIQTRRLRGAISLVQDEMGRQIGRPLGASDRTQDRISRAQGRFEDELTLEGIDSESGEGRARLDARRAAEIRALRRRRAGLRRALRRAKRTRNREAIARVRGELNEVDDQILGTRAERQRAQPTALDAAQGQLAQAELTADKGDDIAALTQIRDLAQKQYEQAVRDGDPRDIAEAAGQLKQAADALRDATPTAEDFASRDLALAQLTEGKEDDLAALQRLEALARDQLAAALLTADPRDDIEAANNLKGTRDAIEALTQETARANEIAQQRMDLERQRLETDQKMVALAQTQGPAILAGLVGLVNDGVGRTTTRASRTPGLAGVPARFG